jgi:hypothetical protein
VKTQSRGWKQAGIDPIKTARKLWKRTLDDKRTEPRATQEAPDVGVETAGRSDHIATAQMYF